MEQAREEAQQQQMQPQNPLQCPRCGSLDTRFRYYNNNSHTQPRHYCRTCKRQWTVGGKLRLIPIGGNTRNGKPTKASSSKGGNSRSQPPQPPLRSGEGHRQSLSLMMTAMVSQLFEATLFRPITRMPAAISPLNHFSNQISSLDTPQSLIHQVNNQHVSARNLFSSPCTYVAIPQEGNVQTMAPQQALSQQNAIAFESYQTHNEAANAPPSHLYVNRVVQPGWPMNSQPEDITCGSSFTTSDACLQNDLSCDTGDTTDGEDATHVNVDEWLNFSGCDSP
ncbi:DNA binding with one finger 4.7 [Perilla frutescens var. frutescens]|nr:DNA binding with one finger 4.7 [Perilla frutescens var. frutescens]